MYVWVIIVQFENFDLQTALTGTVPTQCMVRRTTGPIMGGQPCTVLVRTASIFIYDFMAFDGSTQLLRIRGIVKYGRAPKISTHFTSLRKVDFIEITGSL